MPKLIIDTIWSKVQTHNVLSGNARKEKTMAENVTATAKKGGYTGSGLGLLGHSILWSFLIVITLFIGTPWVIASAIRYIFKNTTVDGRKLTFDGTGGQLIGKWLLWILLTICTIAMFLIIPALAYMWGV